MTIDQVKDQEYDKLLKARDDIWMRLGGAIEEGENFETSIIFILAQLLVDEKSLALPEMSEEQASFAAGYVEPFLASRNNMLSLMLNEKDVRQLLDTAKTNRISDSWNRQLALRFADVVRDLFPAFHVVREHLERIL